MDANPATPENPAERLITIFGDRGGVAERFEVSREAVRLWLKQGIPADRALDVEAATRDTDTPITALEILHFLRQRRASANEPQMALPLASRG